MIALLLGLALAAPPGAPSQPWEPRIWPAPAPGVASGPVEPPPRPGALEAAFRWYRARSKENGAVCPFYPTCSGYGIGAYREWGLPVAAWLTIDRLLREYPWMAKADDYPVVTPHRTPRFHDPVPDRDRPRR